jgi:Ca-activated chloride channel homolog
MKSVIIGFCSFVLVCGIYSQEKQSPKAGKGSEAVLVRVNVTDPLNRYVTGLELKDFRIYEKGIPRTINFFVKESAPLSLAIVSHFAMAVSSMGTIYDLSSVESRQKELQDALQRLVESARPEDEVFLLSYKLSTGSVECIRRQDQTIDQLLSIRHIAGLTSLEQTIMAGVEKLTNKTGKRALAVITAASDLQILRAYDLLSKVGNASELPELQFYTLKREGSSAELSRILKSTSAINEKSYEVGDFREIAYYLDLVYSDLRSQYILGYSPTQGRPTGKNLKVNVEVESPRGLPNLTARPSKPYYAQLP